MRDPVLMVIGRQRNPKKRVVERILLRERKGEQVREPATKTQTLDVEFRRDWERRNMEESRTEVGRQQWESKERKNGGWKSECGVRVGVKNETLNLILHLILKRSQNCVIVV